MVNQYTTTFLALAVEFGIIFLDPYLHLLEEKLAKINYLINNKRSYCFLE